MSAHKLIAPLLLAPMLLACDTSGLTISSTNGGVNLAAFYVDHPPACNGFGLRAGYTLEGNSLNIVSETWSNSDCTGTKTLDLSFTVQITNDGTATAGWYNGVAPARADGGGSLPSAVTVTRFTATITARSADNSSPLLTVGMTQKNIAYIDDTSSSTYLLYLGDSRGGTSNGYPVQLGTTPTLGLYVVN